jgi:chitinase
MFGNKRGAAVTAVAVVLVGTIAAVPGVAQAGHDHGHVVSAYFTSWNVYGRGYHVKDIPADKLNVIQYAFGAPTFDKATGAVGCQALDPWADYQAPSSAENSVDGVADVAGQKLSGNVNQLLKLKAAHPGLKVEISLGGWTKSTYFADIAANATRRHDFVSSCLDTFIKGNLPGAAPGVAAGLFDGIDVDWEYPTQLAGGNVDYGPADRHNATLLFQEFRHQLDALSPALGSKHYLLTAAMPATAKAGQYYELPQAVEPLDWANLMAYDYNVPSAKVAAPNTLMWWNPRDPGAMDLTGNTLGTVVYYLGNLVPANKIVVGVPFYGNQYLRTGGLYQPVDSSGLDPNSLVWDSKPQPTYHDLVDTAKIVTPDARGAAGFTRHWDVLAGEPWVYSSAQSHNLCGGFNPDSSCASPYQATTSTVITYEDPKSIGERTLLIRSLNLRGAMAWEISQDSDDHALISALTPILH